jgi:peptide/nickel transport system substrate-binding protein
MRFNKPLAALSVVAVFGLAACGGGSSDNPSANNSGDIDTSKLGDVGANQDPTRTDGPYTIDGAKEGGIVHVRDQVLLTTTLDPTESYYTDSTALLSDLIARSLTQYSYDEEKGTMILIPDLATDLGTPNDDFTEWKFTIRDGVKYENGDPVTAEDVAFGIERSFDRTSFPIGADYSNQYFLNGEKFQGPYTDKKMKSCGCVTVDGQTLTIKMSRPFPDMPYWGAFPAMGPIPEGKASDPKTYRQHPLSTGPYKFDKYTPAKALTLVRNDQWDPATDPGRTQYPDGYDFQTQVPISKIDQIILNDSGEGETTMTREDVQASDYRLFKEKASDRLVTGGSPCTYYWAPDMRKITDKKVRQALAYAYPYKAIVLAAGLIDGVTAIPATNLMPPGTPGREEFNPLPDHDPFSTDPEKAKALLKEAGAENYEIKFFWRTDNEVNTKSKDALVKGLTAAGFKATPVPTTEAKYVEDLQNLDSPANIRSGGWCSDWPSGSSWFPPLFRTTNLKAEGMGQNRSIFSEPDVDQKMKEIPTLPADEQAAAWNDLDKYIAEKYFPVIPQYYTGVAQAHGSKIHGHFNDNVYGMPTLKNIWIG